MKGQVHSITAKEFVANFEQKEWLYSLLTSKAGQQHHRPRGQYGGGQGVCDKLSTERVVPYFEREYISSNVIPRKDSILFKILMQRAFRGVLNHFWEIPMCQDIHIKSF